MALLMLALTNALAMWRVEADIKESWDVMVLTSPYKGQVVELRVCLMVGRGLIPLLGVL